MCDVRNVKDFTVTNVYQPTHVINGMHYKDMELMLACMIKIDKDNQMLQVISSQYASRNISFQPYLCCCPHLCNLPTFAINFQSNKEIKHRVTIPCKGLSISHEIRRISWNPYEIRQISWNPYEIQQILWNLYEIRQISGEIHPKPCKIRRVFAETSASDFWNIWFHLKSARFHGFHEIHWILWNLLDFMVKSAGFHERELLGDDQV